MRHLIVAVCCGLQAIASAQAPGTASELADDVLSGALWRIAVATHTRIGFESVDFVRLRGGLKDVPAFPISSRDETLKAAVRFLYSSLAAIDPDQSAIVVIAQ